MTARSMLLFSGRGNTLVRSGSGLTVLEAMGDVMPCADCLDETAGHGVAKAVGQRVTCKVCATSYKVVDCAEEYAGFAKAVLDDALMPPTGEFDKDPGTIELSKKYGPQLHVQTVAFLKTRWKDAKRARGWASRNGYHTRKATGSRYYHVFVQLPKSWVSRGTVRIIAFGNGIRAVVGKMKTEFLDKTPDDAALNEPAQPLPINRRLGIG